jgi:hypothetical protein
VEVVMNARFLSLGLVTVVLIAASGCSSTSGSALPAAARGLSPTILPASVGRAITAVGQVAPMESWWDHGDSSYRYPVLTYAQRLLWPPDTTTGGVYVGQRYWVWPYTFRWGPAPYVPLVTTW